MKRVLLVGDLILDIYHFGTALKASAEGLTPISEERTTASYGGAGLVARHILKLGGKVVYAARVGDDNFAKFANAYRAGHLQTIFAIEPGRRTTVKERFVVGGRKVLKWNHLESRVLDRQFESKILQAVKKHLSRTDKIIIADYRHGLISRRLARSLIALGKRFGKPIYVDSQISQQKSNHQWYRGADLLCLNLAEAKGIDLKFQEKDLPNSLRRISNQMNVQNVVVKLSAKGSAALLHGQFIRTPGFKVKAIDPTGAGDAFFAALALAPFPPSTKDLKWANKLAALSTTKIGT